MLREVSSQNGKSADAAAGALELGLPELREILPRRQPLVLGELLVPPLHAVLVQAPAQFRADAQQLLLVGQLEAQAFFLQGRKQVPVGLRERLDAQAVLLPPVQAVRLLAVGQLGARRLAYGVPDFIS